MTALFVLCVLLSAYVEASHFLSTSTSISPDASTTPLSTNLPLASPACFQPRALNDPPASQLSLALTDASAVAYACSNTTVQRSDNGTIYSNAGALFFNITRKSGDRDSGFDQVQPSFCAQYFQNIINVCLLQQSFWAGWTLVGSGNWSVSNNVYPQNLLPIPRVINASSTIGQFPKTQNGTALSTNDISTPASTALSDNPSRLILAIENVVSNVQVSLSAVAVETSKMNDSGRSISPRQSQTQLSTAASPLGSSLSISIDTSTIAIQGNYSKPSASGATKTEESKMSSPASSVSRSASSTQTSGVQSSTITSLIASLAGVNGSANIPPISGPLTIAPDYTITDAFRANLSSTTISATNGAVLIYSMQTFSDLANKTGAPILLQTTVPETLSNGSHVTYIGGVWVASGGRYWFPPGIPNPENGGGLKPGIEIRPPCIWPFCSGEISSDGGGGGDPKGIPPPPYEPPTPPPGDGSEDESDQETQDGHTQTEVQKSQTRSQSAQETTGVSSQTFAISLSSSSTIPNVSMASSSKMSSSTPDHSTTKFSSVTMASTSTVSSYISDHSTTKFSSVTLVSTSNVPSSMPTYSTANLSDGFNFDYNLSIADAKAAALDELSLINAVTVPQGVLWVPTGPQELSFAAQATSPFDLALPTFANFTQGLSLSSTSDSMGPQNSTDLQMQTASSSAALASADANADAIGSEIAAIAFQIASAAAHQPPSSDPIPPSLTSPPATASPSYKPILSAPTAPPTTASSSSNPIPPTPTLPSPKASPIDLFECTQL